MTAWGWRGGFRRLCSHSLCVILRSRRLEGRTGGRAIPLHPRDGGSDLDALGAGLDQDFPDLARVDRPDLHGPLVSLDFRNAVARLDLVAWLDQPLGEAALLHGGRK